MARQILEQYASLDRPVTLSCKSFRGDHRISRFSTSKNHALHDRSAYAKRATDLGNTHAFRVKLTNALFNGGLYRATTKLDATLVIWPKFGADTFVIGLLYCAQLNTLNDSKRT